MTNEELNRRARFFAEYGLPYSDQVWRLLAESWEQGAPHLCDGTCAAFGCCLKPDH